MSEPKQVGWIDVLDCPERMHVFKLVDGVPKVYHSDDVECLECEYNLKGLKQTD